MKKTLTLLSTLLLVACGASTSSLDGKYMDPKHASFTFNSNGKVTFESPETQAQTTTYRVDDKVVLFRFPDKSPDRLTINDDKTLSDFVGTVYTK
jgi:hypothetical protein